MKRYPRIFIIFLANLLFIIVLLYHPKSDLYHIYEKSSEEIIDHYTKNISRDTGSYFYQDKGDMVRTIGYPLLLKLFMGLKRGFAYLMVFNCFLGAWMFHVVYEMIGKKAWLLFGLGAFTAYVPILYTDLLFATLFITSIWQLKKKRFWLALILLGISSLIRPSLAWFFVLIPLVMHFYDYRPKMVFIAIPLTFLATSFSPIRNYVNHGKWTHSTVLRYNIESETYFGGADNKPAYFIYSLKSNYLSGHYDQIGRMFNKYKRNSEDLQASLLMWLSNIICVLINAVIWLLFGIRIIKRKINWGNIIILVYFVLPTLFGAAGARLRLPIEFILFL